MFLVAMMNDMKAGEMVTEEDKLSKIIIGAAIEVHKTLGGPGLLESIYEKALIWELRNRRLEVESQKQIPVIYKGINLEGDLRLDILVENLVIIECKAVSEYNKIHSVQTLTYLRMTGLKLGLVLNFGEKYLRDGIYRVVNHLK